MHVAAQTDVQASAPTLHALLSRVGVTGVEKVIRIGNGTSSSTRSSSASSTSAPAQKGAHMSRFEEVVNDAIGEVILGEATFRAETLAEQIARDRPRAPGRPARRGDDRRALPRAQARAGLGHPHAGDLHALRLRGRRADRHAAAGRRRRPGHDRVPVRAGARRRRVAPTASRARLHRGRDRAHPRPRPRRHPQPARPRDAARRLPGGRRDRDRRAAACSRSSRTRCRRRSTS